jgi:hypothetical protein
MHGKTFLLDSAYAGMDHEFLYTRLDFTDDAFSQLASSADAADVLIADFNLILTVQTSERKDVAAHPPFRLDIRVQEGKLANWELSNGAAHSNGNGSSGKLESDSGISVCLGRVLEVRIPLNLLRTGFGESLEIRFSLWKNNLPVDALPAEGSIALKRMTERELAASGEHWKA